MHIRYLAPVVPLLVAVTSVLAGPDNGENSQRMAHKHRHARHASPAEQDEHLVGKRGYFQKTVTEVLYITVDQNGVPWGTSVETPTPLVVNEYLQPSTESTTSSSHHQHHSKRPSSSSSTTTNVKTTTISTQPPPPPPPSSSSSTTTTTSSKKLATTMSEAGAAKSSPAGYDKNSGLTVKFENGKVPCTEFPASYGALPLDYLGHHGWSGIQYNGGTSDECREGALCSYSCAPGQSKSQWPADQPASGESHGGLLCKDGFLTLTRPDVPYLCVAGKGSASVQNKMGQGVAICRTDYPGTENMVIPTFVGPQSTEPLTVVDGNDYYTWQGGMTSAQFYVNMAGVSQEDGCCWGTLSALTGNFSPMVFGAGYSNGMSCISMLPNPEAKGAKLGYNVEIVGVGGTVLNKECSYRNGVFSGDDQTGCTVCYAEGSAQFVLSS